MSQCASSRGARAGISVGAVVRALALVGASVLVGACGGGGGGGGSDGTNYTPGNGPGNAVLSWSAPTEREDGSAIAPGDIAGYRIHFGPQADPTQFHIEVKDGGQTQYTITGLDPDTWLFAVSTVDTAGQESGESNSMSKTVTN